MRGQDSIVRIKRIAHIRKLDVPEVLEVPDVTRLPTSQTGELLVPDELMLLRELEATRRYHACLVVDSPNHVPQPVDLFEILRGDFLLLGRGQAVFFAFFLGDRLGWLLIFLAFGGEEELVRVAAEYVVEALGGLTVVNVDVWELCEFPVYVITPKVALLWELVVPLVVQRHGDVVVSSNSRNFSPEEDFFEVLDFKYFSKA